MEAKCSSDTLVGTPDIPDCTLSWHWILAGNDVHCQSEEIQRMLYLFTLILFTLIMSWNFTVYVTSEITNTMFPHIN